MPILCLSRSTIGGTLVNDQRGKALILGLFLRRDARKKPQQCAAASALRCVRHQRTMSPRARALHAKLSRLKSLHCLLVSYRPLAMIIFAH